MVTDKRFLPMAWHVEVVSATEVYTFRWGRGAGYLTVHAGDQSASHGTTHLIATVRGVGDWADEVDVEIQAKRWLRTTADQRPLGQ